MGVLIMKDNRPIDKILSAFRIVDLQTFNNILLALENGGHTIEDALKELERRKGNPTGITAKQLERIKAIEERCPICDALLLVFPIERENKDGNKAVFRCSSCIGCKGEDRYDETDPDKRCTYERFSKQTVEDYVKEYKEAVRIILQGS
jgi:hypothetical protein